MPRIRRIKPPPIELNTLNVVVSSLQEADLIVDLGVDIALAIAGPAQAIPIFGDGGANAVYAVLKIAEDAIRIGIGAAQVAAAAKGFRVTELGNLDVAADILPAADNATLQAVLLTQHITQASAQIAQVAAANALLQSETVAVVSNQAIAARDQANVIGSPSDPLGLQVTGAVNVTAGPTDSYLQVVGNTALDQITATGSVTLISTGAITNGAPPGTPNILATGLTIVAANGIGTAANPLLTRVGTLNATNTGQRRHRDRQHGRHARRARDHRHLQLERRQRDHCATRATRRPARGSRSPVRSI